MNEKCISKRPQNKNLHYLVPDVMDASIKVRSKDEQLTHNCEKENYIIELKELAKELNYIPIVHRLLMANIYSSIDTIPKDELVMNLCDGSDIDGMPAVYLETMEYKFIVGCNSKFIKNTLTKDGMKKLFIDNNVQSPPGFGCQDTFELNLKSDSYGSVGLDDQSVCHNETQLIEQCEKLLLKFKDLTVEEFIDGPEFSVLISGTFQDSNSLIHVYPPAERAFMETLGTFQKFVSFDRNWDETKLAHDYLPAYIAVSGSAYGRVDIRQRTSTNKFYVLEVNASCGLGTGSSSEFILALSNQTTKDFFQVLVNEVVLITETVPTREVDSSTRITSSVSINPKENSFKIQRMEDKINIALEKNCSDKRVI